MKAKLKCIFVEDEAPARELMRGYAERVFQIGEFYIFENAYYAVDYLSKNEEKSLLIKAVMATIKAQNILKKEADLLGITPQELNVNNISKIATSSASSMANNASNISKSSVDSNSKEENREESAKSETISTNISTDNKFAGGIISENSSTASNSEITKSSITSNTSTNNSQQTEIISKAESDANVALGGEPNSTDKLKKAEGEAANLLKQGVSEKSIREESQSDGQGEVRSESSQSSKSESSISESAKSEVNSSSESTNEINLVNKHEESNILKAAIESKKIEQGESSSEKQDNSNQQLNKSEY